MHIYSHNYQNFQLEISSAMLTICLFMISYLCNESLLLTHISIILRKRHINT